MVTDTDDLLARYSVVGSVFSKYPGFDHPDVVARATRRYAEVRLGMRLAYRDGSQIPGWRLAALEQKQSAQVLLHFMGIRDDGRVMTQRFRGNQRDMDAFCEDHPDIDDRIKAIAACAATNQDIGDGTFAPDALLADDPSHGLGISGPFFFNSYSRSFQAVVHKNASALAGAALECADDVRSLEGEPVLAGARLFNEMFGICRRFEARRLGAFSRALRQSLDPEVRRIVAGVNIDDPAFCNWLAGKVWHDGRNTVSPEAARNRRQAVRSFPIAARALYRDSKLAEAIDEGRPLGEALASKWRLEPAKIRRLQGLTWQKIGRDYFSETKHLADLLRPIAVDHVPQTRRGFADLSVARDLATVAVPNSLDARGDRDILYRDLAARAAQVGRLAEGNPPAGIKDMVEFVHASLVQPAIFQEMTARGKTPEEAADIANSTPQTRIRILAGQSPQALLEASGRWHRALPRVIAEIEGEAISNDAWRPLIGEVDLGGGVSAVELASRMELRREGIACNHCVGGYTEGVMKGHSLIFSLRRGDKILSTIEFDPGPVNGSRKSFETVQNMAPSNRVPGKDAVSAGRRLAQRLKALPEAEIEAYRAGLQSALAHQVEEKTDSIGLLECRAGYAPGDPGRLEAAWSALSPFLPKQIRRAGFSAFRDRVAGAVEQDSDRRRAQPLRSLWPDSSGTAGAEIPF